MSVPGSTGRIIGAYRVVERLPRARPLYVATKDGGDPERRYVLSVATVAEEDIERVWTEVERYAQLRHPAIAKVYEFFEFEGRFVLVFDHGEGVGLDKLKLYLERDSERLPDAAIWYVGYQVAGALACVQLARDAAGQLDAIAHGHFSPQDVLISWDGEVRLVGLCAPLSVSVASLRSDGTEEAQAYMAPELAEEGSPSLKGDAFAAATLLWSLLTGRPAPVTGAVPSLERLRPDLPTPIAEAIDNAMRRDTEQRTTSCTDLERILDGMVLATEGTAELAEAMEMYHALWGLWSLEPLELFEGESPPESISHDAAPSALIAQSIADEFELEEPDADEDDVESRRKGWYPAAKPSPQESPAPRAAAETDPPAEPAEESGDGSAHAAEPERAADPPKSLPAELGRDGLGDKSESPAQAPSPSSRGQEPNRRRTMGLVAALLVVAVVAALVVKRDELFGEDEIVRPIARQRVSASAMVSTPPPPVASRPRITAAPPIAPVRSVATAGSAQPDGKLPPLPDDLPADGSKLLTYRAYLVVRSAADVHVYVQGKHVGKTNELLEVHCRTRFIRLGAPPGPRWLGPGRGMRIPCQQLTVIRMDPETE